MKLLTTRHNRHLQCFCEGNDASVPHTVSFKIQFCEGGIGLVISTKQRAPTQPANGCCACVRGATSAQRNESSTMVTYDNASVSLRCEILTCRVVSSLVVPCLGVLRKRPDAKSSSYQHFGRSRHDHLRTCGSAELAHTREQQVSNTVDLPSETLVQSDRSCH